MPKALVTELPYVQVLRRQAQRPLALDLVDFRTDSSGDGAGDLVLQFENIIKLTIIALRPDEGAAVAVDQLRRHPDALPGLADVALQHIPYAQLG